MDSAEVGKYIESVAVRIGFHNGGSLAGTGVLYTLQAQKRAVVLTAGHVLQNDSHICPAVLSVWSKSGTKNISLDLSDSDDNKEVNIHYCPGFMYNGRKYVFDAAIIDVPWHDWMVNIPEIRLGEAKISTQIQLIGFPKSTDGEATQEDWTKGRMGLRAELPTSADNDEEKAFKFSYHSDNSYPIERDDIMKGYSGSGLFLCDSEYPQLIYLNAAEFGWDWKQPLTVKEAENTLLEQNKDWKKKESDVYAQKELLEQHQKNLQLEKQNAECTVDKLKTWRAGIEKDPLWGKSVTYLREQSLDFDWNKRLHSLLLQSAEENSKIGDLQEKMNQITEISHSSIEALNTARTRAQKALQNQQKIFSEIAALVEKPEPRIEDLKQAREICVFEQEQKQTQISKLGNVIYSEGVSESIRKYNEYKTKIESLEHKIVTRKQALQKAQEALEAEKKTLLAELQKYFQQPLFNEIYQKIDPHPYMKKVSYEIMYNDEKNEPELYIKTLADKREPYHPELFFSTAQLNTVALSSFLSRALSLTEIPIGTIVIDDPVGHFDDMNILGFADLMRSIIEKSQKQIVITTHDETVYQIFRRKLPPEIYSSRFIDMTAE